MRDGITFNCIDEKDRENLKNYLDNVKLNIIIQHSKRIKKELKI